MEQSHRRIGLFDSGVGGLTVLRQLAKTLPTAQFFYIGDTARLPYGNRSRAEIAAYVGEIIRFLDQFELDAIVMACNTSAALARDVADACAIDTSYKIFDLIAPTARYIAKNLSASTALSSSCASVGVMATIATVNSAAFSRALADFEYKGLVREVACPKLVPLIESGRLGEADIEGSLTDCLSDYLVALAGVSVIILGCTHFAFVASQIEALIAGPLRKYFPEPVTILDPAVVLSDYLAPLMTAKVSGDAFVCRSEAALSESDFISSGLDGQKFFAPDMVQPILFATGPACEFVASARTCLSGRSSQTPAVGLELSGIKSLDKALDSVRQISVDLLTSGLENKPPQVQRQFAFAEASAAAVSLTG